MDKINDLPNSIIKFLNIVKQRVSEEITPVKIILFGSFSRGDFDEDSDLDLMFIIKDDNNSIKDTQYKINSLLKDRTIPLDILVYYESDIEKKKNIIGSLPYEVVKEGEVIYDSS